MLEIRIGLRVIIGSLLFSPLISSAAPGVHNIILFVPDGLRSQIVDSATAPTLARLRDEGVDFRNSHALFPTFTTANASAFATGHRLGDTGDFSNFIYTGVRVAAANATVTPFLENDTVLREVNAQFRGNYLNEPAIVAAARVKGYGTALIGKLGPAVIFDLGTLAPEAGTAADGTLVIDDSTGIVGQEVPVSNAWKTAFTEARVALVAPGRGDNGSPGDATRAGTLVADLAQQQYFLEVILKVVLPHFQSSRRPFVLVFWSRDPDGTQHNQGDSFHTLNPGINGATSLAAIHNADSALALIEAALQRLGLYDDTDIIVAADHGFSTIRKTGTDSPSVKAAYRDVKAGELPLGFLSIDLYAELERDDPHLKLFDPDSAYRQIDWEKGMHPARGNGVIGERPDHPEVVVAANGGSDLIYLPTQAPVWQRSAATAMAPRSAVQRRSDRRLVERIVSALLKHDYVSGVFVDGERFGQIAGALSTADIGLGGGEAVTPHPDIVVNFASEVIPGCRRTASLCAAEVADTALVEGQGMHGSFSRADTWNFMAARGPDFKQAFADTLPASNADVGMTIASLVGLELAARGTLTGRVLTEALRGGTTETSWPQVTPRIVQSTPTAKGLKTLLRIQQLAGQRYLDAAGFPGRTVGLE